MQEVIKLKAPSQIPQFKVNRYKPRLIVPAKPTPQEIKQLSDIDDQQGLRFHAKYIFFFKSFLTDRSNPVRVIREAIAKALVYYYPLAGRLIEGANKKLMVDCNGEGILFIEAYADIKFDELEGSLQPPFPYIDEILHDVPGSSGIVGCPLLLVQVTRLLCDGFIMAIRFNHTICESPGLINFLKAAAELARGATSPSLTPVWDRHILNTRNQPRITYPHHEYEENLIHTDQSSKFLTMDHPNMVHSSFFFSTQELKSLCNRLPPHLRNSTTTVELLTALLWRSRTIALDLEPGETVRVSYFISLYGGKKYGKLELPRGYYGNAFVYPSVLCKAGVLCKRPLSYAVELVKKIKLQMSEEYIKSVVDLMAIKGRPHYATKWNFLLGDLTRLGFNEIDFGWGKPIYGGSVGAWTITSYFVKIKDRNGVDGIAVPILLPRYAIERFNVEILKITQLDNEDLSLPSYDHQEASMVSRM